MSKLLFLSSLFLSLALYTGCIPDPISAEERLASDIKKIEDYLTKNNLTAESTESGLHYIIEVEGTGGHPNLDSEVTVNYKGYFTDDDVFDQTSGTPISFPLRNVIVGWQEGIPLFKKGGKGKLFLPSRLGYGASPPPGIPSNAVLIFDVELVDF
jgi:FKBP-type peptidyl-prolyl cis-trans isomerase FkpA